MSHKDSRNINRREFLKRSAVATAALSTGFGIQPVYGTSKKRFGSGKKVIVIGIDGMDPRLSERLMNAGMLPNFDKLRKLGGFRALGTSIPPQSPVAWANFINGSGPGTHGIFDLVHRDPERQYKIVNSISQTKPGIGLSVGDHVLPLFRQPKTVLKRQGIPFWDYLDEAGISSAVYLVPSNYPPSRSKHGHHRSLSGLGTPDLLGSIGTYQYFTEDGPVQPKEKNNGRHCRLVFKNETAEVQLFGPQNYFLRSPKPSTISFSIHRDPQARAAVIEVQGQRILLNDKQWSDWVKLDFVLSMPFFMRNKHVSGICRLYLKEFAPTFRLYISPISINPADPAMRISEPEDFVVKISKELGQFYTTGFQEEFKARFNNVFSDEEYAAQAEMVLKTRLKLLDYALEHYTDGLLFFYFSSADLQSHMFWWDSDKNHPCRNTWQAMKYHNHIKELYKRMDMVLGDILKRYCDEATIFVLSDHGFSRYERHFNLNTWLRTNGYIRPSYCRRLSHNKESLAPEANWFATRAYGLGINGLYLNLKGRERDGIVKPEEREGLLQELVAKLEAVRDVDGSPVIHKVYRSNEIYSGPAMKYAPDLILGFHRGYRTSSTDSKGLIANKVFLDNTTAWGADHCFAAEEIPGVLFANRVIGTKAPSLVDLAPTILAEFGLSKPKTMNGRNVLVL